MKRKSKNQIIKKKKEFRFHRIVIITGDNKKIKIWHPAYVFLEKGNIFIYVTLTHSNKIYNLALIKLTQNPNPHDNRQSFFVAEIRMDTKEKFTKRQMGWKMNDLDDKTIRELFETIKNR